MQAVTQVSHQGDSTLFFSPKVSDSSFANIYAQELSTPQPEPQTTSSVRPEETRQDNISNEQDSKNKPDRVAENSKEAEKTASTKKSDEKTSDEKIKETSEAKETEKDEEKKKITIVPFILMAPKELIVLKKSSDDQSVKLTEIPPATLRVGGKSITAPTVDLASFMKDLKALADLLAQLKDKTPSTSDEEAKISTLISKISKTMAALESKTITITPELKEMMASLKSFKDLLETMKSTLSSTKSSSNDRPKTLETKNNNIGTNNTLEEKTLEKTVAQLLQDLQGSIEDVKTTQAFKSELIKGIELSQKSGPALTNQAEEKVEITTSQNATLEANSEIQQTSVIAEKPDEIIVEKPKTQHAKVDIETIKPTLSNISTTPTDPKVLSRTEVAKPELAGAPQTANIEKQNAIMSQFRTFLSVNKLRSETEVTLRLHPRELGEIKIQITRMENQATHEPATISAKFQVNSEMVKSVLESNFNLLKDTLQQQGTFNMAQMSVDVQTSGSQNQDQQNSSENGYGRTSSVSKEENIVVNSPAYSPPAHSGDLDRVA